MIETSGGYKEAIVGIARRTDVKPIIDITSPDIVFTETKSSGVEDYSIIEQLHDRVRKNLFFYDTLERNRWVLDGSMQSMENIRDEEETQIGLVGKSISDDNGYFSPNVWIEDVFENVDILQGFSIYFPSGNTDGVACDFLVEVEQGGGVYFSKQVADNEENFIFFEGFTIYNPDKIRITVSRWSLPGRRVRIVEIIPGIYQEWDGDMIASFSIKHQGDISCLSLPYGTCSLTINNIDRRFEPRNKAGIFASIEERQGIDLSIGTMIEGGRYEYVKAGIFYQYEGGWKTGNNGITMNWDLVDIIGLLVDREYVLPDTLPTTLEGWVSSIVSQLGSVFRNRYSVDSAYADRVITANNREDIAGLSCGDILRFACMASATWPRADAETGKLAVEPYWNQGNKVTLDNINEYPTMKANDDVAAIIFTLADGNDTLFIASGNQTSSANTKSIKNPFIHTEEQAIEAARVMLATFGGNRIETTGRGNPSSEIGDVDTVELSESVAVTARRIYQTFDFSRGVLMNCKSILLQADGSYTYQKREIITQDGIWTAPAGVTRMRVIIGNGGSGGANGYPGSFSSDGRNGEDGIGGKIWAGTIDINPEQSFAVNIGAGGNVNSPGGTTTFGAYSGDDGEFFSPSYTDIVNGDAYGRTGVKSPLPNTGDGGRGGEGGTQGIMYEDEDGEEVVKKEPGPGKPGAKGGSGFVVVYYDKI